MNQPNHSTWTIGIDEWILMDGSYNGFEVGKNYQFAVRINFKDLETLSRRSLLKPSVRKLDNYPNAYSIIAPITYIDDEIYMLDMGGIIAYDECPPRDREATPEYAARAAKLLKLKVGDMLQSDIFLNIDYYPYFEIHCFRGGVPPIIYTWHVDSIESMTAEYMLDLNSPKPNNYCINPSTFTWHQTNDTFCSVVRRNVLWHMLHCTVQPVPPVGKGHNIPLT